MVFRSPKMAQVGLCVKVNSIPIPQVESHKHLGLTFHERLSWSNHVDSILKKASIRLGLLCRLRHVASPAIARELCCNCVRPILEYSNVVWSGLTKADAERLERCNRAAARLISNIRPEEAVSHELILARAGLPTLSSRRPLTCAMLSLKYIRTQLPKHLNMEIRHWLPEQTHKNRASRRPCSFRLPRPKRAP